MNGESLADAAARWVDELRAKQDRLQDVYGLGTYERFDRDGGTEELRFSSPDRERALVASTTNIGSYSIVKHTWMWAWANESLPETARLRAARLRDLLAPLDVAIVRDPVFAADEELAWQLAAASIHHLDALGCYRTPSKSLLIFLSIDELSTIPNPDHVR